MNILVAEDDATSARMLQGSLESAGHTVMLVNDGLAAIAQLSSDDGPRIALLDWMMPGLDGPSVCRAIGKKPDRDSYYLILLTVKEQTEDVVSGLDAGADDYLTKPFKPNELLARVRVGSRLMESRNQLLFQATHDMLTGLWKQENILDLLGRELNRCYREKTSAAVLLCDLDRFKPINDTHGHQVGNEVLRETARRIAQSVRSYDLVGRFGGEEFLAILTRCSPEHHEERADQVRRAISDFPFDTRAGKLVVTVSIGVLMINGSVDRPPSLVLDEVDQALYLAKNAGRNCVRVAITGMHFGR